MGGLLEVDRGDIKENGGKKDIMRYRIVGRCSLQFISIYCERSMRHATFDKWDERGRENIYELKGKFISYIMKIPLSKLAQGAKERKMTMNNFVERISSVRLCETSVRVLQPNGHRIPCLSPFNRCYLNSKPRRRIANVTIRNCGRIDDDGSG